MYKIDINPKGIKIYFDEEKHKYWTDKVTDFTSVTTFIKQFFPKFDREGISKRYALKNGLKQEEVLANWEINNQQSRDLGSNIHCLCECYLLKQNLPDPINEKASIIFKSARNKLDSLLNNFKIVASEKIVFSEELQLCGTADLLVRENKTGQLYLLDFKTNKKIDRENRYGKFALNPFGHLAHNNFMHYSIQLNTYRKLFQQEQYFDEEIKMGIIHFEHSGSSKSYRISNMENEVTKMINSHLSTFGIVL